MENRSHKEMHLMIKRKTPPPPNVYLLIEILHNIAVDPRILDFNWRGPAHVSNITAKVHFIQSTSRTYHLKHFSIGMTMHP
jgi:hypothetical protein